MENLKCIPGCKWFSGGEIKHHEHCPHYPESFSKMYDDLKEKFDNVEILINALEHIGKWGDYEEEMWDDPGDCALQALQQYRYSSKR